MLETEFRAAARIQFTLSNELRRVISCPIDRSRDGIHLQFFGR